MSKRPFYDLLPTIECETPRTVQCRLAENPGMQIYLSIMLQILVLDSFFVICFTDPKDLKPMFDVKEFRNAPCQRVYQYLKLSNEGKSLDNFTFSPGDVDEDRKACLMLLLRFVKLIL